MASSRQRCEHVSSTSPRARHSTWFQTPVPKHKSRARFLWTRTASGMHTGLCSGHRYVCTCLATCQHDRSEPGRASWTGCVLRALLQAAPTKQDVTRTPGNLPATVDVLLRSARRQKEGGWGRKKSRVLCWPWPRRPAVLSVRRIAIAEHVRTSRRETDHRDKNGLFLLTVTTTTSTSRVVSFKHAKPGEYSPGRHVCRAHTTRMQRNTVRPSFPCSRYGGACRSRIFDRPEI